MDGPVAYDKRWRHAIKKEKVMDAWRPPSHLRLIKTIPGRVQHGKLTRPSLETMLAANHTASAPDLHVLQPPPSAKTIEVEEYEPDEQPSPTPKPVFTQTAPLFNSGGINPFAMSSWLKPIRQRAPRGMERAVRPPRPVPMGLPRLPPKGRRWMAEPVQADEPQADVLILGSAAGSARSSRHAGQGLSKNLSAANLEVVDEANEVAEMGVLDEEMQQPGLQSLSPLAIPQSTLLRNLPHVAPPEGWQHPPQLLSQVPTNKAAPEYQRFRGTVQFQGRVNWVV